MKSFKSKLLLVSSTTYLTSGLSLLIALILANKLSFQNFGQFIFVSTVVLLLSDLCDFGTGSDFLLRFQNSNGPSSKILERAFLERRLGTVVYLFPGVLLLGIIIFGFQIAPIFALLVIMTFLRNSVAVVCRKNENYRQFLVLLVGEKVILLILIFISHASLQVLLLESFVSISIPMLLTYPYILRTRPNFSLPKIRSQFMDARLTGLASFITNVALIFPLIIQFLCGSDLFGNYILLMKIFSPIPAFGAAIALVNVSSKQMPLLRMRGNLLTVITGFFFLISLSFVSPSIIAKFTDGKFVYSNLNVLGVSIIAILYFILNILVSQKLKRRQLAEIIWGYFLFIFSFVMFIWLSKSFTSLGVVLISEFLALSIATSFFVGKRRASK